MEENILKQYLKLIKDSCEANKKLIDYLNELEDYIDITDISALAKLEITKCLAEGFIVYNKKELMSELLVNKTALAYLYKKLKDEDQLIYKIIDNVTLIKLK